MSTIQQTNDIESIAAKPLLVNENKNKLFVKDLIKAVGGTNMTPTNCDITLYITQLKKKYRVCPSKNQMRYIYEKYFNDTPLNNILGRYMIKKAVRSRSGVLVSTIVLKPDVFSCPKKCSYCPTETDLDGKPTQPKSYLSTEPAMLRALQYNFDIKGQLWDRIKSYILTGNIIGSSDKLASIFEELP